MTAQEQIDALTAKVTKATTVEKSAQTLIEGFGERLTKAVNDAIANGATSEQLVPLSELATALDTESDALAAAVTANTPSA